ncbi:MAG: redoxin domain-containing protein [bacterium]|nr:redoxin domain-containing protein [bacterium]
MKTVLALVAVSLAAAPARAGLGLGDAAPPITVTDWVKGTPVDLASAKGKKIIVLDFWATWCPPCIQEIPRLTQLQSRYGGQDVMVVGVTGPTRGQQLKPVQQFVERSGDAIGYTIGWDANNKLWDNYLTAAGIFEIPYLFIIDKQGKIAWQGHTSPELEQTLDKLIAGTYDLAAEIERAKSRNQVGTFINQFNQAAAQGDWTSALQALDQVLELTPTDERSIFAAYQIRANEMHDAAGARKWAEGFIERYRDNPSALVSMARFCLRLPTPPERIPDVMLRAARRAYEVSGGKDFSAIEVYAGAAHRVGRLDEAVRLQEAAVELAPPTAKEMVVGTLQYYRQCRALAESAFPTPPAE